MPANNGTPINIEKYKRYYEEHRTKAIISLIPSLAPKSTSLDIGCGPGWFTKILHGQGWDVTALDANPHNITTAAPYAVTTHTGNALEIMSAMKPDSYNLACALEIIEHMDKNAGKELLRSIYTILKPKGSLLISTPNTFSPIGFIGRVINERLLRKGTWNAWDTTHVHIYQSFEFIELLKTSGFIIDRVIGYWYEISLAWKMPFLTFNTFPLNRFGFNIIVRCHKP